MNTRLALLVLVCLPPLSATAQQARTTPWWDPGYKFLIGNWTSGQGGGVPGQATQGWANFKLDLQGRVLVRTDHSEYPATKDRPAIVHDGLMIIYAEPGGRVRADYWDNEGYIIHYTATSDAKTAVFLSDSVANEPRYRLTYALTGENTVTVRFEIAPPDKPDQFRVYVEAETHRLSRRPRPSLLP